MGKDNSATLHRQWLLLQRMKRGKWTGTVELQTALQREGVSVTLRTIQRDLKALAERFPLEANGLSPQGWRWQSNAPLMSLPNMTSGQALTFVMVEQHLKDLMPRSVLDELRPWFDSARNHVREGWGGIHRWTEKVRIVPPTQPLIPPAIDPEVLHRVQEALLLNQRIEAVYESRAKKEVLAFDIDPIALIQRGPVLYLVATRHEGGNVRLFALHRFHKVELRDEEAYTPDGFDLDEYLEKGGLGFGNGSLKKLTAIFTREAGEHLHESRLSRDQVIRELESNLLKISATVADTPQLQWWLRGMEATEWSFETGNENEEAG